MKLALVTGAGGFVGSHMVQYLLSRGYEVLASDRPGVAVGPWGNNVRYLPMDLEDSGSVQAIENYSFNKVFHIAGLFDYTASWEKLFAINCLGTKRLLNALTKNKSSIHSIVVWSSGSVYGRSFKHRPIAETETPLPINAYEKSKWLQEQEALGFIQSHHLPVIVVRPAAIYGPQSRYGLAIPIFMIKSGILRFIPGKGDFVGGYAHVDDVVAAAEFLSGKSEAVGQIVNISDDSVMPVGEALELAASILKVIFFKIHIPLTPIKITAWLDQQFSRWLKKRPLLEPDLIGYLGRDSWMDNTKLKKFGYSLKYPSLKAGLPEVICWYQQHGWI